jgi:hypothetical protein
MRPEVEQELSHTLLIELLAYQFASPVRWIETQDVVLGENTTERIVEIGPADTLGVMAKRTLASKYEAHDAALSVQRQILCYNKDAKDIYYDVDPVEDEPEAAPAASGGAPAAASSAPAATAPAAAASAPSAGPAAQVPDAPVTATDILRALVAQKLKKPLMDIPLSKAIKDLVGGKQFETLGETRADKTHRQVYTPERDSRRLGQGIWLHPREARRHAPRRARCFDAGYLQWSAWKAIILPHCPYGVFEDAWWLQYHSCAKALGDKMGSGAGTPGRRLAPRYHK